MNLTDIIIKKQNGSIVKLLVKIQETESQFNKGLMFVKKLLGYDGMLFDFGENQVINMWMKDTYIPLDILFFDSSRKLIYIHENTVPLEITPLWSGKPVRYVLEIGSGQVNTLGITV